MLATLCKNLSIESFLVYWGDYLTVCLSSNPPFLPEGELREDLQFISRSGEASIDLRLWKITRGHTILADPQYSNQKVFTNEVLTWRQLWLTGHKTGRHTTRIKGTRLQTCRIIEDNRTIGHNINNNSLKEVVPRAIVDGTSQGLPGGDR